MRDEYAVNVWALPEVKKQADAEVGRSQVIVKLSRGSGRKACTGLELKNHHFVHYEIETLDCDRFGIVDDSNRELPLHLVTLLPKLYLKGRGIN